MEAPTESPQSEGPLTPGQTLHNTWTILKEIGSGGFGTVYKASCIAHDMRVAVKVTKDDDADSYSEILWELNTYKRFGFSRHCPKMIGYHVVDKPHCLILELLGPSLSTIRRRMGSSRQLSKGAVAAVMRQCLQALRDLHDASYVHRDVKPANFSIGLGGSKIHVIYLIDFGMCKRYCLDDRQLLVERQRVGFRGTVRYASVKAHMEKDLCRADDLTSLFYMMYEMLVGQLPWKWETQTEKVFRTKCNKPLNVLARGNGECMRVFAEHIQSLSFEDEPEYGVIDAALAKLMHEMKFTETSPFGWEDVLRPDEINCPDTECTD